MARSTSLTTRTTGSRNCPRPVRRWPSGARTGRRPASSTTRARWLWTRTATCSLLIASTTASSNSHPPASRWLNGVAAAATPASSAGPKAWSSTKQAEWSSSTRTTTVSSATSPYSANSAALTPYHEGSRNARCRPVFAEPAAGWGWAWLTGSAGPALVVHAADRSVRSRLHGDYGRGDGRGAGGVPHGERALLPRIRSGGGGPGSAAQYPRNGRRPGRHRRRTTLRRRNRGHRPPPRRRGPTRRRAQPRHQAAGGASDRSHVWPRIPDPEPGGRLPRRARAAHRRRHVRP